MLLFIHLFSFLLVCCTNYSSSPHRFQSVSHDGSVCDVYRLFGGNSAGGFKKVT